MSRFHSLIAVAAAATSLAAVPAASAARSHHPASDPPPYARVSAGCQDADTPAVGAAPGAMRRAVVCLINVQRSARRLPALRESTRLDRSAQGWTNRMVNAGEFTHGTNFWNRISAVGYYWSNVGENIAAGFTTPRQVVDGWMASQGHCENILAPQFSDVGTGVDTRHLAQFGPATWTQDFGLLMGQPAPSRNGAPARGCPYRVS